MDTRLVAGSARHPFLKRSFSSQMPHIGAGRRATIRTHGSDLDEWTHSGRLVPPSPGGHCAHSRFGLGWARGLRGAQPGSSSEPVAW
eukprot:270519-Pyramimonas_sp.AAC.1